LLHSNFVSGGLLIAMSVRLNFGDQTASRYGSNFDDTGCEAAPSCLACPLPQCRYDDPDWYNRLVKRRQDQELVAALRDLPVSESRAAEKVAARFGVTVRTVFRAQERMRKHDNT